MDKVRFACPKCQTIMQTAAEKVGYDVACPRCAHRFRLIGSSDPSVDNPAPSSGSSTEDVTLPPSSLAKNSVPPPAPAPVASTSSNAAVSSPVPKIQPQTGFRCPYCQTQRPPNWKSEVSQVGWIVFAILLVSTCVFCFVGLFIRDKYRTCSQCKIRLG